MFYFIGRPMPLFLEEAVPPELGHFKVSDLHYKLTHIQKPHGNGSALPVSGSALPVRVE